MSDKDLIDLVVCMEELAELQQAISKFIRGKDNISNLHEEYADVTICLEKVHRICGLDSKLIIDWIDIKNNRNKLRGD